MHYTEIFTKESLKAFRATTKEILDNIPTSASVFDAIFLFDKMYDKKHKEYDLIVANSLKLEETSLSLSERLFYICMTLRVRYKNFFPAPSLCLLLCHTLNAHAEKYKISSFSLENLELLPILLLLSEKIKRTLYTDEIRKSIHNLHNDKYAEFFLYSEKKEASKEVISLIQFSTVEKLMPFLKKNSCYEENPHVFLYTSWNFLSNKEYKRLREDLVRLKQIERVIQLPLPSREGSKDYPAIVLLSDKENTSIDMLDLGTLTNLYSLEIMTDLESEDLILEETKKSDKEKYFNEVYSTVIHGAKFDWAKKGILQKSYDEKYSKKTQCTLPLETLYKDKIIRITPSYYILQNAASSSDKGEVKTLGDYVEVLRYQEDRTSVKDEVISSKNISEFGVNLFREVSLKDLDPLTGFYLSDDTEFVRTNLDSPRLQKYILQEGDIVFAFKGSKVTLGTVGYISFDLNKKNDILQVGTQSQEILPDETLYSIPAVPGNSFVILRVKTEEIDSLYLFHYLQRAEIQAFIQSRLSGTSVLSINVGSIKSIPLYLPTEEKTLQVKQYYKDLEQSVSQMIALKRLIKIKKIENINL